MQAGGVSQHHQRDQHEADLDSEDAANLLQSGDELDNDDVDTPHNGKRKRPMSVSCELCKQRKVKCDRGQPSCGWCTRNSHVCEYKERKKPGLRAGYGRELELRLDQLERILYAHSEILKNSQLYQNHHIRGPSITSPQAINTTGSLHGSASSNHGTPIRGVEGSNNMRSPSAIDFGLGAHDGFKNPNTLPPIAAHGPQLPPLQPNLSPQKFFGPNSQPPAVIHSPGLPLNHPSPAPCPPDHDLPPYDLLYSLVDLYFRHIYQWCPILHNRSTLDALFGRPSLDEGDRILLHAIVATTLRYSTDHRLTEERRQHYHDMSKQKVLLYGMENLTVKALQALVILALDLLGSSNGPPGWNIMALITRSVVQLGLAVESTSLSISPNYPSINTLRAMILPEPRDFIEEESRRRLFWMIYLLDRYATIATAFEFALDDREIDRMLPCRDDLWFCNQRVETRYFRAREIFADGRANGGPGPQQPRDFTTSSVMDKPDNLGPFSYYVEVMAILSKIHKFLKQPINISNPADVQQWQTTYRELDDTLEQWRLSLPREFGDTEQLIKSGANSKSHNATSVMLHAFIHTAVIRLNSSAAYPTTRSTLFTPSYVASQRCLVAVEKMAQIGNFAVSNRMLPHLGPPFAFTLWVAARLLLVHGSTVEHKLSPLISFFVEALREMGTHWPVARRYCELLERVLDEHQDSERQGDRVTPNSVKILADMRRTAFDLDFLISRAPRRVFGGGGGVNGNVTGATGRFHSVTPARTPAPNELEYLDVFDFFNVPRLPFNNNEAIVSFQLPGGGGGDMQGGAGVDVGLGVGAGGPGAVAHQHPGNEFNITNFSVDASSDWLFKEAPGKYHMSNHGV